MIRKPVRLWMVWLYQVIHASAAINLLATEGAVYDLIDADISFLVVSYIYLCRLLVFFISYSHIVLILHCIALAFSRSCFKKCFALLLSCSRIVLCCRIFLLSHSHYNLIAFLYCLALVLSCSCRILVLLLYCAFWSCFSVFRQK